MCIPCRRQSSQHAHGLAHTNDTVCGLQAAQKFAVSGWQRRGLWDHRAIDKNAIVEQRQQQILPLIMGKQFGLWMSCLCIRITRAWILSRRRQFLDESDKHRVSCLDCISSSLPVLWSAKGCLKSIKQQSYSGHYGLVIAWTPIGSRNGPRTHRRHFHDEIAVTNARLTQRKVQPIQNDERPPKSALGLKIRENSRNMRVIIIDPQALAYSDGASQQVVIKIQITEIREYGAENWDCLDISNI